MVKPVSLSNPAFDALRREKRRGESDSDVVLRLLREAKAARRNPRRFLKYKPKRAIPLDEHEVFLTRMDEADRRDARSR